MVSPVAAASPLRQRPCVEEGADHLGPRAAHGPVQRSAAFLVGRIQRGPGRQQGANRVRVIVERGDVKRRAAVGARRVRGRPRSE